MTGGETVEVRNWKGHGLEGRRGMVIGVTKAHITVKFSDWSPTVVIWDIKDADCLHVVDFSHALAPSIPNELVS